MRTKLNLDQWNRKEHFLFFKQMEEPFFGITSTIDCTKAYEKAKASNISFFTYYLHKTLMAVNAIENFRYRIVADEIFIYDQVNASATIMREDKTFAFSLVEFSTDMLVFAETTAQEIERIHSTSGLFTRNFDEPNLIHFSSLPWVNFTSLSHARSFTFPDSCPKISFGKMMDNNGKKTMSISIHVHHGLMDGYHVGLFLEEFEKQMTS